jgi:ABC-type multidrug transport system permease subunit
MKNLTYEKFNFFFTQQQQLRRRVYQKFYSNKSNSYHRRRLSLSQLSKKAVFHLVFFSCFSLIALFCVAVKTIGDDEEKLLRREREREKESKETLIHRNQRVNA